MGRELGMAAAGAGRRWTSAAAALLAAALSCGCVKTMTDHEFREITQREAARTSFGWRYMGSRGGYHYLVSDYWFGTGGLFCRVSFDDLELPGSFELTRDRSDWVHYNPFTGEFEPYWPYTLTRRRDGRPVVAMRSPRDGLLLGRPGPACASAGKTPPGLAMRLSYDPPGAD